MSQRKVTSAGYNRNIDEKISLMMVYSFWYILNLIIAVDACNKEIQVELDVEMVIRNLDLQSQGTYESYIKTLTTVNVASSTHFS